MIHTVVNGQDNGALAGPRLVNVDDTSHWLFAGTFDQSLALAPAVRSAPSQT